MKRNEPVPVIRAKDDYVQKLSGRKLISVILIALLVFAAGIMYAEPVKDGDLWFHLAYARYMVENSTLIADHTIYSWTPSDGGEIYCAWLAETVLYYLFTAGGTTLLFALRYVFILAFISLVFLFAWRRGVAWHPLTWLICLAGLLMAPAGVHIKPEIFSYVLMTVSVFLWLAVKSSLPERWRLCYLFPVLLAVWINTHGGVIFGATFLGVLFAGEAINGFISPEEALAPRVRKHFFIALALCGPVMLLTPYGWEYPFQLFQNFVVNKQGKIDDFMTVGAYQTIFHPMARAHHFIEYLAFAGITLGALLWQRIRDRKIDWALILMNLVFAALYVRFIRATYFWAIIFTFTAVHLLGGRREEVWGKKALPYKNPSLNKDAMDGFKQISSWKPYLGMGSKYSLVLIVALFLFFSGRSAYESLNKPLYGFFINYVNPVEEAQFIRKHLPGLKMGNDYDSGCYLLWALWPETKVFIDARYFPYKGWYDEYSAFMSGRNVEAFMGKYRCDMWVLTYDFPGLKYFLKSGEWRLVHYGPSACVFLSRRIEPPAGAEKVSVFQRELTVYQAMKVLRFALAVDDLDTARKIVNGVMEKDYLLPQKKALSVEACIELGSALEKKGLVDEAITCFNEALAIDRSRQELSVKLGDLYQKKGDLSKAASQYSSALSLRPDSAETLQRLAVVYSLQGRFDTSLEYLFKLLALQPGNSDIYYNIACIYAKQKKTQDAARWLEKAVGKGFRNWDLLKTDPDLGNIRGTLSYKNLVENQDGQ